MACGSMSTWPCGEDTAGKGLEWAPYSMGYRKRASLAGVQGQYWLRAETACAGF